jgi:hypothetical protein
LKETSKPLRDYLKPKIENNDKIGTDQYEKGMLAKKEFKSLVGKMMNPNTTNLILMTSIEMTDRYGRLTSYVNRKKKKTLGEVLTEEVKLQDSFKMKMLATGYAFMYLVYPNLVVEKEEP